MQQQQLTLPSGHKLVINPVPFALASQLRRLVSAEIVKVDATLSETMIPALLSNDRQNVLAALSGSEVNVLKNLLFQMLASKEIEDCVIDCMGKWILDGEAVKSETFEEEDRRGDLIPCAVEVGKRAILPFFASLGYLFPDQSSQKGNEAPK